LHAAVIELGRDVDFLLLGICRYSLILGATSIVNISIFTGIMIGIISLQASILVPELKSISKEQHDWDCLNGIYCPSIWVPFIAWPGMALACAAKEARCKETFRHVVRRRISHSLIKYVGRPIELN